MVFGLEIHFKKEAVVEGSMLTLGDVAMIKPFSKAQILSDLILFQVPSIGEQQCFDHNTFKGYVLNAVTNKESIRWTGAEKVCILRPGDIKNSNEIQAAVDAELQKALRHLPAKDVFFESRNLPEIPEITPGSVKYDVTFSDPDILKSRQVNVIVKVDGRLENHLTIAGQVHAYLPVVVATEKMNRGTLIESDQVKTEIKNIAELTDPCLEPAEVIGKSLKRAVAMNQVITENDLDLPVIIERRQLVTMILQKGALRISTKGRASANGKLGDVIMVKNAGSHQEIPCRIIGPGITMVEF